MVKKLKPGKCGQTAGLIGTNCTHADSSRKGTWPTKISGGLGLGGGGGVGGQKFKSQKKHM